MPKSYSGDLRERVIEAVEGGASRREAAERFEVATRLQHRSVRNNCSARPRSRIPGANRGRTSRSSPTAGTEFLDAETGRQKPPLHARTWAETKIRELSGGKPRRNALFGVVSETCGLRRLDGGRTRARTWDPIIKSLALTVLFQLLSCKLGRVEV